MGKKVRLLAPDAPVPEVPSADGVTWDVWEINSEDETFSKEAQRLGLTAGLPVSLEHGWDITNQKHQAPIFQPRSYRNIHPTSLSWRLRLGRGAAVYLEPIRTSAPG